MNLTAALWQLQTIDQDIDDKTQRLTLVDESLANDPAVKVARATLAIDQKKLADLRAALHNRELEAKGLDAKIKELNQRLYSGTVSNPKELDGLSKDLEMHTRQRSSLDDRLLELMDGVEQAQARFNTQSGLVKQVDDKRASELESLARERETLAMQMARLDADREKTRSLLGGDTVRIYDRLRLTKGGRALGQLRRDSCGACGVTVPTGLVNRVRGGAEIVYCTSCGRILTP
jgi:hypothetical protein